jgi:hypothetical protein
MNDLFNILEWASILNISVKVEFKFETNLRYESEDTTGSSDEKQTKDKKKSYAW